jgi:hypothetical protein
MKTITIMALVLIASAIGIVASTTIANTEISAYPFFKSPADCQKFYKEHDAGQFKSAKELAQFCSQFK